MKTHFALAAAALTAATLGWTAPAAAQGTLSIYCGVPEEWCRATFNAFTRQTGIRVAMTRKSAGEIFAQVKAEASNPRGDVWFGGTGDSHLQAAEENLTLEYRSPMLPQLHDWATKQAEQSKFRTVGIFAGALGFGFNTREFAKVGGAEPRCWSDLLDPRFRNQVQSSDPNASGTAYTHIATMVQLMGEEPAFDYMKKLHANVNQYNRAGGAAARNTGTGETLIGITFIDDMVAVLVDGAPVKVVAPCEGTGYQVGSMSIIRGTRQLDLAKKFYDWALTPDAQVAAAEAKFFHVQSNKGTPVPAAAPKLDVKLIDYNFAKYGAANERRRLLARWDAEIRPLAR